MSTFAESNADSSKWQDLNPQELTNDNRLENIKGHLDLILLALEAIADISSEAILGAAQELNLTSVVGDRTTLWRLRASNPQRQSSGGRKKLDIVTGLARNWLLRKAVSHA